MLKKAFNLITPSCDLSDTIIVTGAPRSGTTWLAEILNELPGYKLLNEPLRPNTPSRAGRVGFSSSQYILDGELDMKKQEYIFDVLTGKIGSDGNWYYKSNNTFLKGYEHLTNRKVLVKFCRAGGIINCISKNYAVRSIVTIMRHPCATIDSMMRWADYWREPQGDWIEKQRNMYRRTVPDDIFQRFKQVFEQYNTWEEHLAIRWSLEYYFLLTHSTKTRNNHILISYEKLLQGGVKELEKLLQLLDIQEDTDPLCKKFDQASKTSSNSLMDDVDQQIYKWKKNLTGAQIESIQNIVQKFGINTDQHLMKV